MLHEFILSHRDAIIAASRMRVASRRNPRPTDAELMNGVPIFLDQLGDALRLAESSDRVDHEGLAESARAHGADLLHRGLSIGQVVHDYGDVCQSITELAVQTGVPISTEEFRILNLCLDDAIAGAVTEFARRREAAIEHQGLERLGVLAHELRNVLSTGSLAYSSLLTGKVAIGGSTGQLLGRSLTRLARLIDSSLADVRLDAGIGSVEQISVAGFLEELQISASILAGARGLQFSIPPVAQVVTIEGDRQILVAAVSNLLQNAFKFTHRGGTVSLTTHVTAERVLFDVEDECGGLPPGKAEELFVPFSQRGVNRTGAGLGLAIALKAAKANGGEITVRDLPGKGCVFTLDLPRKPPPPLEIIAGGATRGTQSPGPSGAKGSTAGLVSADRPRPAKSLLG